MLLRINKLIKKYKDAEYPALNNICIDFEEAKIHSLLGPNGAGKSTLINIITGLFSKDSGEIEWSEKPNFGLVPQDISLFDNLTAFENLDYYGSQYGIAKNIRKKRINEYLTELGLYNRKDELIKNYSGGMKRRINIIAALIHKPNLLILDEPTVGVDVQSKNAIHEFLLKLNTEGMSMIYTSHLMEEAEKLSHKVSIIDLGEIIKEGSPKQLIEETPNAKTIEDVFISLTGKELRDR